MVTSCGSSKNTAGSTSQQWNVMPEASDDLTRPERKAMEKPDIRAYGEGVSSDRSTAKSLAENEARAAYQKSLESKIKAATEKYTGGYNQNGVSDEAGKFNDMAKSIASGVVYDTVIIDAESFRRMDGKYRYCVCIEYRGDRKKLANSIASKAEQNIPDDIRMKINYDYKKFSESVEEELANMK